jgi:hypothetical protein
MPDTDTTAPKKPTIVQIDGHPADLVPTTYLKFEGAQLMQWYEGRHGDETSGEWMAVETDAVAVKPTAAAASTTASAPKPVASPATPSP